MPILINKTVIRVGGTHRDQFHLRRQSKRSLRCNVPWAKATPPRPDLGKWEEWPGHINKHGSHIAKRHLDRDGRNFGPHFTTHRPLSGATVEYM